MSVIEVDGLVKDYRVGLMKHRIRALNGLGFKVDEGEIVALLGPNGAGKSTTLRIIFDFIRPTLGEVKVFGSPSGAIDWRKRVGYMPEYFIPSKFIKGRNFLDMVGKLYNLSDEVIAQRLEKLSNVLDLEDLMDRKLGAYSRGMMQKIGLAQAMLPEPELLVLDEPTANLDATVRKRFKDFLEEELEHGKTVLISSHVLSEIEELATRVIFLKDGRVHTEGTIDDLLHPAEVYDIHFHCDPGVIESLKEISEISSIGPEVDRMFSIAAKGKETKDRAVKTIVESGGAILHLALQTESLENVFIDIMGIKQ